MLVNFAKLLLSSPLLVMRLMTLGRIKNLIIMFFTNPGNFQQTFKRYYYLFNGLDLESVKPEEMNDGRPVIIVFPVIDWAFRYQRPQHLSAQLAKQGALVFYLGAMPLMKSRSKPYLVSKSSAQDVYLVQVSNGTCKMPNMHQEIMHKDELTGYQRSIDEFMLDFNIIDACLLVQHPYWFPLVSRIKSSKLVYDCIDDHSGFYGKETNCLASREVELINSADVVVASSQPLVNKIEKIRPCTLVRNGCEYERFSVVQNSKNINCPIMGYIGAVSTWFDIDLIAGIAEARPEWNFVIVGSRVGCDVSKVRNLSNVKFVDEVEYSQVPNYLETFDVCLIPFKICSLTMATNPVKVYEYLASGRPVVSTKLPELEGLEDIDVFTANNPDEFVAKIEYALKVSGSVKRIEIRKSWARQQDWSIRAAQMLELLVERKLS